MFGKIPPNPASAGRANNALDKVLLIDVTFVSFVASAVAVVAVDVANVSSSRFDDLDAIALVRQSPGLDRSRRGK